MTRAATPQEEPTCFVVMGYGKKTDFATGRSLDLDKTYRNIIKPAVAAAGLKCVRADEIVHSGQIDVPMYDQLLKADVVVADLSTSNANAFYELGVRHALRPFTTVVISEDGLKAPFDVNHVVVRTYHHMGEDIGFEEVMRFREVLTNAIKTIRDKDPRDHDSPVYTFIKNLKPPEIEAAAQAMAAAAPGAIETEATLTPARANSAAIAGMETAHSFMMERVDRLQEDARLLMKENRLREAKQAFQEAKTILATVRSMRKATTSEGQSTEEKPEDPYIVQRLALLTYKSKEPDEATALKEAASLLETLNPKTSNDTETLGLWGAVCKRMFDLNSDREALSKSIRAYQRGFYLRNDYYNGINFAFMLNVRASRATDAAEAIADFVQARRVRKEVLEICSRWTAENPAPAGSTATDAAARQHRENEYWVTATMAEAYIGAEHEQEGNRLLTEALAMDVPNWMKESTQTQVAALRKLLEQSPLRWISS